MLKDFLDTIAKIKSRPLLIVFSAIALTTFAPSGGPSTNPFTYESLAIPIVILLSDIAILYWVSFIRRLNSGLSEYDSASFGPFIGGSILAFCFCITFWYVANSPNPFSIKLLGSADFIRTFSLYLLAIETINIKR